MPDQTGVPTFEEVEKWQKRWKPEWLADVQHILKVYPKSAVWRISKLKWYSPENGFERWPEADAAASAILTTYSHDLNPSGVRKVRWVILDLRGIILTNFAADGCRLQYAHLEGSTLKNITSYKWNMNFTCISQAYLIESSFVELECFGANLRHTVIRAHLHKCKFQCTVCSNGAIAFSTICDTTFSDGSLEESELFGSTFFKCDFGGTRLYGAKLGSTRFFDCGFRHARLRSSNTSPFAFTNTFFGHCKRNLECAYRKFMDENDYRLFLRPTRSKDDLRYYIEACSQIRLTFKDNGLLHEAARYYEQEEKWRTRLMWRALGSWRGVLRFTNAGKAVAVMMRYLSEWLIGYGERPGRVVLASSAVIVLCALLFLLFGIVDVENSRSPRTVSLLNLPFDWWPYYAFVALRFSIECFTTLGFSMIQPAERVSHWVASIEGLIGVLFIAMATVTWARKVIRD